MLVFMVDLIIIVFFLKGEELVEFVQKFFKPFIISLKRLMAMHKLLCCFLWLDILRSVLLILMRWRSQVRLGPER